MARTWMIPTLLAGAAAATMLGGEESPVEPTGRAPSTAKTQGDDADIAAINANIASFSRAYQARDVKAIAALFAPEARLITEDNEIVEGREAIAQGFADHFEEEPTTRMELTVGAVKLLNSDLAVETGTTKSIAAPDAAPEYGKYTVLHAKRDGKWLMLLVRDMDGDAPSNHERLLPLAWMVGDWVDESPESLVSTSCRWSPDGNFLLQDVRVQRSGKAIMQVSQRIGWDPLRKRIRAWVFDSEGGYGESVWSQHGDEWVAKAEFVRNDGVTASATNVFTRAGKDAYVWRSADRVLGDDILPTMEVTVVRKPPAPTGASTSAPIAPGNVKRKQPGAKKIVRP
jgi:uncharacterized protein (TIGR02246 family)